MDMDGRGRWYRWSKRDTVDDRLRLAVSQLGGADLSRPGTGSIQWSWADGRRASVDFAIVPGVGLRLSYAYRGQPVPPYLVRVVYTRCNYGGVRPWWICPSCGRRVAHLYLDRLWACRRCSGLTHASKQGAPADALLTKVRRRLDAIRRRLGLTEDDHGGTKPLGMHWRTYWRLRREYVALCQLEPLALYGGLLHAMGDGWAELGELRELWAEAKQAGDNADCPPFAGGELADLLRSVRAKRRAGRGPLLTLAELAQQAGVTPEFARAAVGAKLLRADSGRGGRHPRYRFRLAAWLRKLHELRAAGMSWSDIRSWTGRRWAVGHEDERQLPAEVAQLRTKTRFETDAHV